EALRQSGILIVSSTLVIWGLVFIIGLECGVEGAYFDRANGVPAYAGVFSAWCDLRELVPYAFGYMMAAKVGPGIVAELGSARIRERQSEAEMPQFSSEGNDRDDERQPGQGDGERLWASEADAPTETSRSAPASDAAPTDTSPVPGDGDAAQRTDEPAPLRAE